MNCACAHGDTGGAQGEMGGFLDMEVGVVGADFEPTGGTKSGGGTVMDSWAETSSTMSIPSSTDLLGLKGFSLSPSLKLDTLPMFVVVVCGVLLSSLFLSVLDTVLSTKELANKPEENMFSGRCVCLSLFVFMLLRVGSTFSNGEP